MQDITTLRGCYGNHIGKTIDAICINGHYKDPRLIYIRAKCLLALSAIISAILFPIVFLMN